MKFLLFVLFTVSTAQAQSQGADTLKTIGSFVGVDLRSLDTVMGPQQYSCAEEPVNPNMNIDQMIKSAKRTSVEEELRYNKDLFNDPDRIRGDVRFKASKYGGKGGVGVHVNVNENSSFSVGAGPKSIGIKGKIKIP